MHLFFSNARKRLIARQYIRSCLHLKEKKSHIYVYVCHIYKETAWIGSVRAFVKLQNWELSQGNIIG